jgi:signal transduction histidine kinase
LRAHRKGDEIVIEVEDDGPGIALKHHARIFEPFARLTKVEGTGLGLAFVQKTVAAWGGQVNLRAAAGHGCIFSISLPAAPVAGPIRT